MLRSISCGHSKPRWQRLCRLPRRGRQLSLHLSLDLGSRTRRSQRGHSRIVFLGHFILRWRCKFKILIRMFPKRFVFLHHSLFVRGSNQWEASVAFAPQAATLLLTGVLRNRSVFMYASMAGSARKRAR
jgi:hypothetical protein